MTTSGTNTFFMTRDDIISASLRAMEVIGAGESASPEDLTNCGQALNLICKAYANKSLPLWCRQQIPVALQAGVATYTLGPATNTPRPVRILQAFLRNADGTDVPIAIMSWEDYNAMGSKSQASQVTQIYYDPQLVNGMVTVYGVPPDSSSTLMLLIQRQLQDVNLGTDNPDVPQEAYHMLKWKLIEEVGLEYGVKVSTLQIAANKAAQLEGQFEDANQEQTSHFFVPSGRGYQEH